MIQIHEKELWNIHEKFISYIVLIGVLLILNKYYLYCQISILQEYCVISFRGRGSLTITALTFLKLLLTMRRKLPVSENSLSFFHCSSLFLILMVVNFDLSTVLGIELSIVYHLLYLH